MNFKFATSVILKASALGKPQKSSFFSGKGAPSNLVAKRTFFCLKIAASLKQNQIRDSLYVCKPIFGLMFNINTLSIQGNGGVCCSVASGLISMIYALIPPHLAFIYGR